MYLAQDSCNLGSVVGMGVLVRQTFDKEVLAGGFLDTSGDLFSPEDIGRRVQRISEVWDREFPREQTTGSLSLSLSLLRT